MLSSRPYVTRQAESQRKFAYCHTTGPLAEDDWFPDDLLQGLLLPVTPSWSSPSLPVTYSSHLGWSAPGESRLYSTYTQEWSPQSL